MALNFKTKYLTDGEVFTVFEAPRVMTRVFFGIYAVAWEDTSFSVHISFDDPKFINFVSLSNIKNFYEFECSHIPQGSIFIKKISNVCGSVSAIEILK